MKETFGCSAGRLFGTIGNRRTAELPNALGMSE